MQNCNSPAKLLRAISDYVTPLKRQYVAQRTPFLASAATSTSASGTGDAGKTTLKMFGWQIHSYGEVDELQCSGKLKVPQIRDASQCLVRVCATSINPIDVAMLHGYGATALNAMRCQPDQIEFPLTLGREFCGTLVQRGMGARSALKLGERVWGVVPLHLNGAHAEYVAVPDYCLAPAPEELSNSEAAAVLYGGLTAWSGLYLTGGLGGITGAMSAAGGGANKRVLVLGGSGSVGSLAIQILKAEFAQVVATCSEDAVPLVKGFGADYVANYKNPDELAGLCNYAPFDIILDCAAQGPEYADTINLDFHQYITFSSPMLRNIESSGIYLGLLKNFAAIVETNAKSLGKTGGLVKWGFFVPAPQGIDYLNQLVKRKKLLPTVDSNFKFNELPEAFKRVQCGHLRGKVIVNFD